MMPTKELTGENEKPKKREYGEGEKENAENTDREGQEEVLAVKDTEQRGEGHIYDMIIIGGGPAGYTAALYAAREGLDVLLLERLYAGGQMSTAEQIDNYPAFGEGIGGAVLAEKMKEGAERFGAKSVNREVLSLEPMGRVKRVHTKEGVLNAKSVVIATGAAPRELGLANERELIGRGVSYCASCDGFFYRDRVVVVVGGGNSAAEDALILSRVARRVIMVHRRDTLRAEKIYRDALLEKENISFIWDSTVTGLCREGEGLSVRIRNLKTEREEEISCDGAFISIGRRPESGLALGILETDSAGYIVADETTRTGIDGIYAVGDVRTKTLRQVVTATADGAVSAYYAGKYLESLKLE